MKTLPWLLLVLHAPVVMGCNKSDSPTHTQADSAAENVFSASKTTAPEGAPETAFDQQIKALLPYYLTIQEKLAADTLESTREAAQALVKAFEQLKLTPATGPNAESYATIAASSQAAAQKLAQSTKIDEARQHFKSISKAISLWARDHNVSGIDKVWCSMAPGGWLQRSGPVRNPYYGASMLECGEKMMN
ncbi:MAG: DUF3347 domain-containing protein [Myxococcota bacterium]